MNQITEKTHRVLRVIGEIWEKLKPWDLGRPKMGDGGRGGGERGGLGGGVEGSTVEV